MTPYDLPRWGHLIAAIAANPDDDVVRLACSDWLQEQGEDERAELVRVQIELAKTIRPTGLCECNRRKCERCKANVAWESANSGLLTRQARLLTANNRRRWFPGTGTATDAVNGIRLVGTPDRGFVSVIRGRLDAIRRHLPAIVAREPVTELVVTDREPWEHNYQFHWQGGDPVTPLTLPTAAHLPLPTFEIIENWALEGVVEARLHGTYYRERRGHHTDIVFLSRARATSALTAALLAESRAGVAV